MDRIFDEDNAYLSKKKSFYDIVPEKNETIKRCKEILGMSATKSFKEAKLELSKYIK